jgi:short-subunit dehydrogenase
MSTPSLGTAIVTGASSGIGKTYAERLAARGYDLLLVARRLDRLDALAAQIASSTGRKVATLQADLSQRAGVAAVENVLNEDPSVTLLVNNAGISLETSVLNTPPEMIERLIAVNTLAPTLLASAAAKAFVARDKGAIINIASVLAYIPELIDGMYSGTKAHLVNLTLGLAPHLANTNVRVQAVLPGATRTEIWDTMGMDPDVALPGQVMDTAELVDAALVGFDRGEVITIPPLHDESQFQALEAARAAMAPNLSTDTAAPRYRA